ncbi:hypothetical protein KY284_035550 [Solanum tuberosum]|nr:hypothetical protein KY284_035550 [Solanum tuberosum]
MAQKKKCVSSHGHENLANRKAPNKKKFIINTKNSNQIISNGEEEATQKFNKKKKKKSVRPYQISGKSIVETSNDNTDQMEIDQVIRIYLQEEIMMDILSRLPVRSLLRNDQNSQKFLITESFYDKNDVYNFSTSSLSTIQVVQDEQKLDCPSSCKPTNDSMILLQDSMKKFCCGTRPQENQYYFPIQNFEWYIVYVDWDMMQLVKTIRFLQLT